MFERVRGNKRKKGNESDLESPNWRRTFSF